MKNETPLVTVSSRCSLRKHAFYGILTVVSLLGLGITQSAKANLINNGDFETNDFTGWTLTTAAIGSNIFVGTFGSPDNTPAAGFGAGAHQFDTISQAFATTPGTFYNLSFFYQVNAGLGSPDNHFVVLFNGVNIYDNLNAISGNSTLTFNLLATGSSTTLEFEGFNGPARDILDDVSVTPVGVGVPDTGSTVSLLGFASLGLVALRRKLRC